MSDTKQLTLPITGMTCANCVASVERNLKKLDGIESPVVNLSSERATFDFDPNLLTLDAVIARGGGREPAQGIGPHDVHSADSTQQKGSAEALSSETAPDGRWLGLPHPGGLAGRSRRLGPTLAHLTNKTGYESLFAFRSVQGACLNRFLESQREHLSRTNTKSVMVEKAPIPPSRFDCC